ncbi:MAG: TlpA disulfide reductase family protein [Bacteroidales bacterium]|nr:TlpA disulfide reductase family protein [Bacteroidales bacterium]
MKKLFFLPAIIFLLTACSNDHNNIICHVEGLDNDSLLAGFIKQTNTDSENIDTLVAKNGRVKFDYPVDELHEVVIIPFDLVYRFENGLSYPLPASRIRFFMDSGDRMKINAEIKGNYVDYTVSGNSISEQLSEARKMKLPLFRERIEFETEYNKKAREELGEQEQEAYWENRNRNNEKYTEQSLIYIRENPDSEYSARLLLEIRDREQVSQLYSDLHPHVKSSFFGNVLSKMIRGWAITTPGVSFPGFELQTLDGDTLSFDRYRGKYIVIDFWGSWCIPCLAEIPDLKSLYETYGDDLLIIGIACNDNPDSLKRTLDEYNINWPQVIEGEEDKKYSMIYGIRAYPTKILIGPDRKVIKSYTGIDSNFYSDIESILNNNK